MADVLRLRVIAALIAVIRLLIAEEERHRRGVTDKAIGITISHVVLLDDVIRGHLAIPKAEVIDCARPRAADLGAADLFPVIAGGAGGQAVRILLVATAIAAARVTIFGTELEIGAAVVRDLRTRSDGHTI